ncbi:MAG: hypothetical protein K940chlam8_00723 [Chlamydiae bacterium]|nr:hypothetical protein [Chlamydiota bacterium]
MSIRLLPSIPLPPFNFERTKIHFPTPISKPSSQLPSILLTTAGIIGFIATIYFIYMKFLNFDEDYNMPPIDFGFGYVPTPRKPDPITRLWGQNLELRQTFSDMRVLLKEIELKRKKQPT